MRVADAHARALTGWASDLRVGGHVAPSQVADAEAQLQALGLTAERIGRSSSGRTIRALRWGRPDVSRRVVAYAYPHPDEPHGAAGLLALGRALAAGDPPGLQDTCWWLVMCADPDQAKHNTWIAPRVELERYVREYWRPTTLGLEVDYAFPIDHPPFWQPRGDHPQAKRTTLPESLALAELIERVRPQLVCCLHGDTASGVYTYVTRRPDRTLVDAWDMTTAAAGLDVHRGELPDPGRPRVRGRGDVLAERDLAGRLRAVEARLGPATADTRFIGPVSVAQFCEALDPGIVVLTPEVPLFDCAGVGDVSPAGERRVVHHRGGRCYIEVILPDGQRDEVHVHPCADGDVRLTRGMALLEELHRRAWWQRQWRTLLAAHRDQMADSDMLRQLDGLVKRPVLAADQHVARRALRDPAFRVEATVAQIVQHRVRGHLQTCADIGLLVRALREQDIADPRTDELLEDALSALPDLSPVDPQQIAVSQIGRLLVTAAAVR